MRFALINQKGGVGKTSLTLGLAAALADLGRRVLVVDADPQHNATDALEPLHFDGASLTTNDVIHSAAEGCAADAVLPTTWPGVDLIPAELALATRQGESVTAGELRLRRALSGVDGDYAAVLIDCPPALGSLSVNALVAADRALVVTEPGLASVQGVVEVLRTIDVVRPLNPQLAVGGLIVNRTRSTREASRLVAELEGSFGPGGDAIPDLLWTPYLPDAAVVSEAYGAHVAVQRFPTPRAREVGGLLAELAARLLKES